MTSGEARGEAARRSAAEQRARRAHDLGLAAVITLGQALGGKDFYTFGHAARVAAYTRLLARALGWPDEEVQRAEQAAYVHDIGKLAISDRVLRKAGPLNDAEWAQMREHTVVSANVLGTLLGEEIAGAARHHHERVDGSGYPDGLTGRAIPEIASAICLADSYDAMSHTRPYRRALSYEEASLEVRDCAGSQFDSVMAAAFGDVLVALRRRKRRAETLAAEAAAAIDPEIHARLRTPQDMERREYASTMRTLHEIRGSDAGCITLVTADWWDGGLHIVMDCDADPGHTDPVGTPIRQLDEPELLRRGETVTTLSLHAYGSLAQPVGWALLRDRAGAAAGVVGCWLTLEDDPAADSTGLLGTAKEVQDAFGDLILRAARSGTTADLEAITDDLTALYNHRYFQDRLGAEVARALGGGSSVALLLADVDGFRTYNETHGWGAGDEALRGIGGALEAVIGAGNAACRYSEDLFAGILFGADAAAVAEVGERFRAAVTTLGPHQGLAGPLTVSVGTAVAPDAANAKWDLVAAATRSLTAAKAAGKDRVAAA